MNNPKTNQQNSDTTDRSFLSYLIVVLYMAMLDLVPLCPRMWNLLVRRMSWTTWIPYNVTSGDCVMGNLLVCRTLGRNSLFVVLANMTSCLLFSVTME